MNLISKIIILLCIVAVFSCKKKEDSPSENSSTITTTGTTPTNTTTANTNTFTANTNEMVSFSFGTVTVTNSVTIPTSNCSTSSYSLSGLAPIRKIHFETNLYKNNTQYFRVKNRGYVTSTTGYYLTMQDLKNAYSLGNHSYSDNYSNDGFALYVFNTDGSMWSSEKGENSFNQTNSNTVNFNIIDTVGYYYNSTYPRLKVKASFNCWMYYLSAGMPADSFYVNNGSAIFSVCN